MFLKEKACVFVVQFLSQCRTIVIVWEHVIAACAEDGVVGLIWKSTVVQMSHLKKKKISLPFHTNIIREGFFRNASNIISYILLLFIHTLLNIDSHIEKVNCRRINRETIKIVRA
jgi:hypothetical protein